VSQRIEIKLERGESRVVPVDGARVWLGSAPDADVCVRAPGLSARHLCFVRTDFGYRVEPASPGGTVDVNGEELFCKDLAAGDRITVAGVQMRWVVDPVPAPAPVAIPRRSTRSTGRRAGPQKHVATPSSGRGGRQRRSPNWLPAVSLFALVLVGGLVVLRAFSNSTWPRSPQHYVDLARAQFGNRQPQRALDTLAFALREATGATRDEALALEADIRRMQLESAELPKVIAARQEQDLLSSFEGRHLRGAPTRAAAREFVRLCDDWRQKHGEVCSRHGEGQALLRAVDGMRARHAALAALGEPDTEADVLFAARSRLDYRWRDYRGAMERLDGFLRQNPDSAAVRKEREQMLADGEAWLLGKLQFIDGLLDRRDAYNAGNDLAQLERWSVLPEWQPLLQARRSRLDGMR
jgi:hypothetical protein